MPFAGRHDAVIDCKWRLFLPVEYFREFKRLASQIFVSVDNGCLKIYPFDPDKPMASQDEIAKMPVRKHKNGNGNYGRITIPDIFRETSSFWYGRTITVAGVGDHLELWPRPPDIGAQRCRRKPR